jgi:NADH-quinone oxidoreductase subunit L
MVDLHAIIGFEGIGINAWMVWILPFVGAALIPVIAKVGNRARNYAAVGFAFASALSAATLLPVALDGG